MTTPPLDLPALRDEIDHAWRFVRPVADHHNKMRALIARVEELDRQLDAADRQIEARSGETAAERIWKARAEAAEAKVAAARELAERFWPESLADAVPRTEADKTARVIATRLRTALDGGA